jgi:hypothetical protein
MLRKRSWPGSAALVAVLEREGILMQQEVVDEIGRMKKGRPCGT